MLVIGAGIIGVEIASTASDRGLRFTMVEIEAQRMARVLRPEFGTICAGLITLNGVDLRTDTGVVELVGVTRVTKAVLSDVSTIEVDPVVSESAPACRTCA